MVVLRLDRQAEQREEMVQELACGQGRQFLNQSFDLTSNPDSPGRN
jgi:hypothetical protein